MPPDKVDDQRVQKIIEYSIRLARQQKQNPTDSEEASMSFQMLIALRRWDDTPETPLSRIESDPAWKDLLELPEKPLDQNFNLMAAEHYAFARQIALGFGDPHTDAIIRTYHVAKGIALFIPGGIGEKLLRTAKNHPVLPESDDSKRWASMGAAQGLLEYKKSHNGNLGTPFSARGVLTNNATAQYKRASESYPTSYFQTSTAR